METPVGHVKTVTDAERLLLLQLQRQRDHHAFVIGVATLEWQKHLTNGQARCAALETQQHETGEAILRAHGCDPATGGYTVDTQTGEIRHLVVADGGAAEYVPVTDDTGQGV
jgi:hypothetical protein